MDELWHGCSNRCPIFFCFVHSVATICAEATDLSMVPRDSIRNAARVTCPRLSIGYVYTHRHFFQWLKRYGRYTPRDASAEQRPRRVPYVYHMYLRPCRFLDVCITPEEHINFTMPT